MLLNKAGEKFQDFGNMGKIENDYFSQQLELPLSGDMVILIQINKSTR